MCIIFRDEQVVLVPICVSGVRATKGIRGQWSAQVHTVLNVWAFEMVVDSQSSSEGEHPRPTMFGLPDPNKETSNTLAHVQAQTRKSTRPGVKLTTKKAVGNVAVSMATTEEKREQRWQGKQMFMVYRPLQNISLPDLVETFRTLRSRVFVTNTDDLVLQNPHPVLFHCHTIAKDGLPCFQQMWIYEFAHICLPSAGKET